MFEDCPKTLLEAARYFSDLNVCNEYMKRIKWPGGVVTCPKCGARGQRIGEIATRHMLRCKDVDAASAKAKKAKRKRKKKK